jgi:hypothetical protein
LVYFWFHSLRHLLVSKKVDHHQDGDWHRSLASETWLQIWRKGFSDTASWMDWGELQPVLQISKSRIRMDPNVLKDLLYEYDQTVRIQIGIGKIPNAMS